MLCTDIDMNITFMNPVAEKMSGWSQSEALGQPILKVLHISFGENGPLMENIHSGDMSRTDIEQDVVHFENKDHKVEMLMSILARDEVEKVVVFGETKFGVQRLSDAISKNGIPSEAIHGNKSQSQRERALKMFKDKNNNINVLVATDVAARGLDIPDVTHVINYDIPQAYDDYIHRIGRAGRAGKVGYALTFVGK